MNKPLSKEEYDRIYSKVTRLTVEILLIVENKILLTKRAYEPCIGQWHIPGGTVHFNEYPGDAVLRVAKEELNIEVAVNRFAGFLLYPVLAKEEKIWPIGAVYEVNKLKGEIQTDYQASEFDFFKKLPQNLIEDQKIFLQNHYDVFRS